MSTVERRCSEFHTNVRNLQLSKEDDESKTADAEKFIKEDETVQGQG